MVNAIGREPVHVCVPELHPIDRSTLDVVERDLTIWLLVFVHEPDYAQVASTLQRENDKEVDVLDIDVQLVVGERALGVNVGDVEVSLIGSAREFDSELVSNR